MKVHELAKQLNVTSKAIKAVLAQAGIPAKSHLTTLDEAAVALVKKHIATSAAAPAAPKRGRPKREAKATAPAAPKKGRWPKRVKAKEPVAAARPKPERKPRRKKVVKEKKVEAVIPKPEAPKPAPPLPREPVRRPKSINIKIPITVSGLATNLMVKTSELIKTLMNMRIFATVNQALDEEIVQKVAEKYNVTVEKLPSEEEKLFQEHEKEDREADLTLRPPVVTMMGHVDHGKTSLLDAIRKSNVVEREAGKITQHIGAYEVNLPGKGRVTFLDTPGHSAFTAMRSRGANITDVVVLVVAADDGVMPQTIEAINHAKAANTPIVVAINKSDLAVANPDKVRGELQKHGLVAEDWGGKTIMVKVSAKTGAGVDELLEMLLLEAEVLELKANPHRLARGAVIEGKLSKSLGSVANVLVQNGTLHVGDIIVCSRYYGKVRALHNDRGKNIKEAGPSTPVEVLGLSGVPDAGEKFYVMKDERQARLICEKRLLELKERTRLGTVKHLTLEGLYDQIKESGTKELKIIIKADVQGSVEVLKDSLEKISSDKIKLKVIHGGAGGINESDVVLAAASDAIIIGFHVKADAQAQNLIEREQVDVRYYKVIYNVINDVRLAMEGLLEPTIREETLGTAVIQQIFKASRLGNIAGCIVRKGKLVRNQRTRLVRDNIVIHEGRFHSLKRFKDDVREVSEGYECGAVLENYNDIKVGDVIECYKEEKVAAKL